MKSSFIVMKQKALVILAFVFVSAFVFETHQASRLRGDLQMMEKQKASMAKQISSLQVDREQANNRIVFLTREVDTLTTNSAELQRRLREEVASLRIGARDLSPHPEDDALFDPALTAVRLNTGNQAHRESFGFQSKSK